MVFDIWTQKELIAGTVQCTTYIFEQKCKAFMFYHLLELNMRLFAVKTGHGIEYEVICSKDWALSSRQGG